MTLMACHTMLVIAMAVRQLCCGTAGCMYPSLFATELCTLMIKLFRVDKAWEQMEPQRGMHTLQGRTKNCDKTVNMASATFVTDCSATV